MTKSHSADLTPFPVCHATHELYSTGTDRVQTPPIVRCRRCDATNREMAKLTAFCPKSEQLDYRYHNEPKTPWVLRKLNCFEYTRRLWRFTWGEVNWRWGLSLNLLSFEEHYSFNFQLLFGSWYIKLPRWLPHREPEDMCTKWGFTWSWDPDDLSAIHVDWGHDGRIFHLPWSWTFIRRDALRKDLTWRPYESRTEDSSDLYTETHPYRYCLQNFDIQEVQATLTVQRYIRRRRWLRWTPYFEWVDVTIDVSFANEIGERTGSWKGGVIGVSYRMRDCEAPVDTLRRMERERRFT